MWSIAGLCLDIIGVLALGFDVIRLQRAVRLTARENLRAYLELEEKFGGIPGWLADLEKSSHWIPGRVFQEHHIQDETSYNAQRFGEITKDIANATAGMGKYLFALSATLISRARDDAKLSATSLQISAFGLVLIVIGFIFQVLGVLRG